MKKLILLLTFIWASTMLSAQDFTISGYVTDAYGIAVNQQEVCVNSAQGSNNPFTGCVLTNPNGWYSIVIPNGGTTGTNQVFYVSTFTCDSVMYVDTVFNMQGIISSATVNFTNVNQPSVGGVIIGGNSQIYPGASTGVMTLSGFTGFILRWEKRMQAGVWTSIAHTAPTYEETPTICTTWEYRVVVKNGNCAQALSSVKYISCQMNCNANFTYQANGLAVTFIPASTDTTLNYYWGFGDGTSSTLYSPTHTYADTGTYSVFLYLSGNNCVDTSTTNITIGNTSNCTAAFTYQTNGLSVSLTPTMANTTATYTWDLGDGHTSTQYHPTHTYAAAGTYTVCLYVTAGTCTDSTCQTIVVGNINPCNVSFTYSAANTPPNTIQFAGTASPGITTTQWFWDFGDGNNISGHQNPAHTYAAPGYYFVTVAIKDIGTSNILCSYSDTIIVGNATNCQASFTHTITPNGAHVFAGQFSPATTATGWHWDFGDGTSGTGQTVTHHFTTPGTYHVCLTVNSTNCPAITYCQTITVTSPPVTCNANFTYQQSGASVHFFNNNSGIAPSSTMNYHWDFGDGHTSNLVNPTHTYTASGTYNVCLTVSDSLNNCYDQYCQTIVIGNNTTCQASFTYTYGSVYNAAFFGNFSPMSNSVQWHWDFGDSTTSNLQNPVHHFPGPGTYNVCLTVTTTTSNCPAVTYCQTITIQGGPSCNAYFTYQVNNANVHFHAISSSNTTTTAFAWDFGDGNQSHLPNPTHTYLNYGTYDVCLTVTDSLSGCTDTFCQTLTIGNSGGFGGQIIAGNNGADMGTVYLLSVVPNPNSLTNSIVPVASTVIDSGGYYLFQNIPFGNYLVQAHLDPASTYFFDYLPTYYGDVLYWSQATFVSVGQYGLTVQYDINLISAVSLNNGNGQISGGISLGSGSKSITDIENVMVVLLDEFDIPLKHTYSNAYGYFEFTDLPYGTYKVFAEIWGKEPIAATISLDDANPTVDNVHITINEDNVIASIEALFNIYIGHIGNIYPNPASDLINIELFAKQNLDMQFSIYNIYGIRVAYNEWAAHTGNNRFSFNVGDLSDGIYFVSLSVGNHILHTKKFSKIK